MQPMGAEPEAVPAEEMAPAGEDVEVKEARVFFQSHSSSSFVLKIAVVRCAMQAWAAEPEAVPAEEVAQDMLDKLFN